MPEVTIPADARRLVSQHVDVSRETLDALAAYVALLTEWQAKTNLIAPSTIPDLWSRHILDSAQLARFAGDAPVAWVDLGTGAGLPGMILALLLGRERLAAPMLLVESNAKKVAFLHHARSELGAYVEILPSRIESSATQSRITVCSVVSARALAPLGQLITWAAPTLRSGGRAVFPKGRRVDEEIAALGSEAELFRITRHPSVVDSEGCILEITADVRPA
ncbi:MAG: 16S rRNA (guanine(527)-N(7))-methyltransferase RsmG, partial [Pseudomonadota bacterium]